MALESEGGGSAKRRRVDDPAAPEDRISALLNDVRQRILTRLPLGGARAGVALPLEFAGGRSRPPPANQCSSPVEAAFARSSRVREIQLQNYQRKVMQEMQSEEDLRTSLKLYKEGKYEDTLEKFESVLGSKPEPTEAAISSYNVACSYSKLGRDDVILGKPPPRSRSKVSQAHAS